MPDEISMAEVELAELREAILADWIVVTSRAGITLRAMQATVSWRVTRPLRLFRLFSNHARETSLADASQLVAVRVASRLGFHR